MHILTYNKSRTMRLTKGALDKHFNLRVLHCIDQPHCRSLVIVLKRCKCVGRRTVLPCVMETIREFEMTLI